MRLSFPRALVGPCVGVLLGPGLVAQDFQASMARLEARMQGRLGVLALRGSRALAFRASERFAYCSTFKWVLGAAVLKAAQEGRLTLDQPVPYTAKDLLPHSPVTQARLGKAPMTIGDLCAATIATSDNTAANLLEAKLGGPSALQAFVRGAGDSVMRFDRLEPDLNENSPGDPRDTTSPEAMARLLERVLESRLLTRESRDQLMAWMMATTTGTHRIRAGVPKGWTVGNKTGTGNRGAVNDVAVIRPPQGPPIYLCIFTDGERTGSVSHEAALAEATRQVVKALAPET